MNKLSGLGYHSDETRLRDFTIDDLKKTRTVTFKAYKLSRWQELLIRLRELRRGKR